MTLCDIVKRYREQQRLTSSALEATAWSLAAGELEEFIREHDDKLDRSVPLSGLTLRCSWKNYVRYNVLGIQP
jgi:hypothetical protein